MAPAKTISVLIAEKAQDARDLIKETVHSFDGKIQVLEATDSNAAEFKAVNQRFDIIILSVNLPGKDFLKVLSTLSQLGTTRKPGAIILLTINGFDEKWTANFKPLFHLQKPFETADLKAIIPKALWEGIPN